MLTTTIVVIVAVLTIILYTFDKLRERIGYLEEDVRQLKEELPVACNRLDKRLFRIEHPELIEDDEWDEWDEF